MGHSLNIKDTDVKVLGRTVSITTDNTFAAAEQLVDESFNPNVKYSGAFEDNSQWTINRLLKSKIDALSDGIPSDINPASTESYGIVRLASGTNDPDDYDVVTMNLFRPVYGDVENNKTRLAKLEECCEEVQEFIKKKDVALINIVPNTTMENDMVTQRDEENESMFSCDIKAAPGYYIKTCYGVTPDDVEYVVIPPVGPYPTKRTIIGHSPNELQHDIYIEGETERLPGLYKTITIIGDGVTQKAYPVSTSSQDFEFTITPDVGYQRGPITPLIDDFQKITVGPSSVTINFTGGTGDNRDVITGVVQGTLSDDVTINTNDFYIKIAAGLKLDLQHCSVELQDGNDKSLIGNAALTVGIETDLHGTVKYRENLIGDITVDEDYTLKSVKVFADYNDYHKDYDVNLTGMHLSVSDVQFDFFDAVDIIQEHFTATTVAAETILQQLIDSILGMKYGPIITLQIVAERVQTCSITYNGSNYNTTNNATQVVYGDSYSTTITPASGYKIDSVTVTMNGTPINQAWDRTTGNLTIGSVTGPVVITVNTSSNVPQTVQYNVTYQYSGLVRGNVNFGGNNGQPINVVTSGNKYSCSIAPQSGYHISSAVIKTTSGGQVVASTYSNNLLTSTNNITEDITVTITGGANEFIASIYPTGYKGDDGEYGFTTGDMPMGLCYGRNYNYEYPSKGWAVVIAKKAEKDYWWGDKNSGVVPNDAYSNNNAVAGAFNPDNSLKVNVYAHIYAAFAEDTGGTGKIKIMRSSGKWTLSCDSHYIDYTYGFGRINGNEALLLDRVKDGTLSNYYMDNVFGIPNKLTFSQATGTQTGIILFTALPNTGGGTILHIISVSMEGGIPDSCKNFKTFYIMQPATEQAIAYRLDRYTASPYSADKSILHKFIGPWKRVIVNGDGSTTDAPANVLTVAMDYSGATATLSSNSGTASDMLTITSNSDEGPNDHITSNDRSNAKQKQINFIETINEEQNLITFILDHSSDEAGIDNTPIQLKDSVRSDNYISDVSIDSSAVITGNTDPNADIHISGYGKTGTVSVTLYNTTGITSDNIAVKYVAQTDYSNSRHSSLGNDDEHLENIMWIPVDFTYVNGVVHFLLGSGMIIPAAGSGIGTAKRAPWKYVISLS